MEFDKNGILNRAKAAQQTAVVMDEGLRAYMLKVYNYMATGILLTGIVALLTFKMSVVTNDVGSIVGLTTRLTALAARLLPPQGLHQSGAGTIPAQLSVISALDLLRKRLLES